MNTRIFICGYERQRAAAWKARFEAPGLHVGIAAARRVDGLITTQVLAFAINRPRRCNDQPPNLVRRVCQDIEQERGAADVDAAVAFDFVHRLTGTGFGREMDDGILAGKRSGKNLPVGDVPMNEGRDRLDRPE